MSVEDPFERLGEDGAGNPPELAEALQLARGLEPSAAEWQRCARSVEGALAAPAVPAVPPSLSVASRFGLAVVATGLVAGGLWLWPRAEAPADPTGNPSGPALDSATPQHRPPSSAAAVPSARGLDAVAPAPSSCPRSPLPEPAASPPSELELLEQARAAVATRPAAALELIAQHQRQYPRSVMSQERELLRVEALLGAGNRSAAEQAARRFQQAYPRSLHNRRLDALLGQREP